MKEPTIAECLKKADLILNGQAVREEVSDWAPEYVSADDPAVEDENVWEMLVYLSGFDLKDSPDSYLHTIEELKDWMQTYKEIHGVCKKNSFESDMPIQKKGGKNGMAQT
ncbi:DNA-binding protein [Bacillus velezensis]|nr:DNA-binding protein [Bacillus velezensis]